MMLRKIIIHQIPYTFIFRSEGYFTIQRRLTSMVQTMRGWDICIQYKGGLVDFIALKYFKESYSVELEGYIMNNRIQLNSVFT